VSRWLGLLELATLASLVLAALSVAATLALWPWLRRRLCHWHPRRAAHAVFLAAAAPILVPALGLALCLLPGFLGEDHCPRHFDHAHLCLHHPGAAQGGLAAALLGLAALGIGWKLAAGARELARAERAVAGLGDGGPAPFARDARLLASEAPISLTLGALRPRIVLSEGLVAALPADGLACVLAHEREHVRRRDALWMLLARAASWPHPPRLRRALLAELRLAAERACDEAAAEAVGDRLLVAETILAVEKLLGRRGAGGALACAFGESDVEPRVEGLLAEPGRAPRRRPVWVTAAASAALAVALAGPFHHAVEHLLSRLLTLF
jgi:Zn-dependent protease with chaperone function